MAGNPIFVTGGTGYIGRPLVEALLLRGHSVHALVRAGSEAKLPRGAPAVVGDVLYAATFAAAIPPRATLVHLIGTPHPKPSKAAEFDRIDFNSIRAAVAAAQQAGVRHLVYVSVAHPAPVMRAYIAARDKARHWFRQAEYRQRSCGPVRLGAPGHRWPYLSLPFYAVLGWFPAARESARRLGLVTLAAMIATLVRAVEAPPASAVRIVEVSEIRRAQV